MEETLRLCGKCGKATPLSLWDGDNQEICPYCGFHHQEEREIPGAAIQALAPEGTPTFQEGMATELEETGGEVIQSTEMADETLRLCGRCMYIGKIALWKGLICPMCGFDHETDPNPYGTVEGLREPLEAARLSMRP